MSRGETLAFIRRERAALRASLCSQNEFYLAQIRANSANAMAQTKAISLLEAIDDQAPMRRTDSASPGIVIRVVNLVAPSDRGPRDAPQIEVNDADAG